MDLTSLLFPLLILLLFIPIFLSGRRQKRQMAEMQAMQNALQVGDMVMTTSGLRGLVVATYPETVHLEISDGVVTAWMRAAVKNKIDTPLEDEQDGEETESSPAQPPAVEAKPELAEVADAAPSLSKDAAPSLSKDDSPNGTSRP